MRAEDALRWLRQRGSKRNVEGMARYAITSPKAFGVSAVPMRALAKKCGRDHALALKLWDSKWHEARIVASLVDEPDRVTPAQMDRWAGAFDNWAVCDSVCFHLFDRTPHAWAKARQWSRHDKEFVKRAGFTLIAGLAVHDKQRGDRRFLAFLPIIERHADDERNFVKKAINWALRQIGKRNPSLNAAAVTVATRLSKRESAAARWVGKDALRELTSPAVQARLVRRYTENT
jgi:3-methyladenine DNA glycosylase AlkD